MQPTRGWCRQTCSWVNSHWINWGYPVLAAIPLFAAQLGANFALIGVAAGARHVGTMVFDVPAGLFVSRFGQKPTMIAGTLGIGILSIAAGASAALPMFIVLRFGMGASTALWSISRQAYIADVVPIAQRGRALALFGGMSRLATIAGPVSGGVLALVFGFPAAFYAQGAVALLTGGLVIALLTEARGRVATERGHGAGARLTRTLLDHRRDFATAGLAAVTLQLIRNGRQTLIPLWGAAIGLDVAAIGSVISVSSIVDSTLFYPVGVVMDRWGRKWVFVPSLLVLSAALTLIPVTHSFTTLMAVGVLAGLGNGLGSGVVFTLGVGLAPRDRAGEFLGVWRLIGDTGGAAGPFVLGWIAQVATLGVAAVATGGFGYFGAAIGLLFVRETLTRRRRR